MFETLPNPSLETIFMVGRAVLLIGAFWVFALAFTRWRRADERDSQRLTAQMERAFVELRTLHETVAVMSARIESLAERSQSEPRAVAVPAPSVHRGYDLAVRLARNGAGSEELVTTCGITRHEADLLVRLHSAQARESAAATAPRKPAFTQEPVDDLHIAQAERAALTQPTPPSNRKRGSLLSVVG